MTDHCVIAIYERFDLAKKAIQALENAQYPAEQVSLVTYSLKEETIQKEAIQYGDETENEAAMGAGIGGLLGLLLGAPLMLIPGIGWVLMAGPIATGMTGAIVGGLVGAMSGWGIHTDHVKEYEAHVKQGKLLVVANGDPQQVAEAQRILNESGAEAVHLHAASSVDSPGINA